MNDSGIRAFKPAFFNNLCTRMMSDGSTIAADRSIRSDPGT